MNKRGLGGIKLLIGWIGFLGLVCSWGAGAIGQTYVDKPSEEQTSEEWTMAQAQEQNIDPRLVAANTRFGFKLFSQLWLQDASSQDVANDVANNILISPSSVAMALAMTYNGANGTTQQAMAEALELQEISLEELNQANAALIAALENADPNVRLSIANSLWGRQDFSFNSDFLKRNQEFYNAEITTLDFTSPEAVTRINNWVNANTAGKIPTIVDRIDPDLVLFLINAVYFKGNWTAPFDATATIDRPFYLLDGTEKQHPMMQQQGRYRYAETDQFQAVSLPYGNRRFSMYIFLPKPESNLSEFQSALTAENWETWMTQFSSRSGSIEIPRFTFEYSSTLNQALQAIGMEIAFSEVADFSNLSETSTTISEVKHKTFIEVNEEGTEAAAATSVGISPTSARPPDPPFELRVDRPFFLAIRDDQTGTLLFLGSVVEPEL